MMPPQRPATVSGLVALMGILGGAGIALGTLGIALLFPFPALCGLWIVLGVLELLVAVALYTMQRWAWVAAVVLGVLSAALTFPIGTFPAAILLVYLFKADVKGAFGVGPPAPPPMWGMAPPYVPAPWEVHPQSPSYPPSAPPAVPPVAAAPRSKFCRSCGSPLGAMDAVCPACGTRAS